MQSHLTANRGTSQASGTLRYVTRTGRTSTQTVTLGGNATKVIADVASSFGLTTDSTGFLSNQS